MDEPLRWGILGAANFALNHMAPAIHSAKNAALVALATRDSTRATPFQAFCPGLRVHESYESLLADPEVDAVYIPLPNSLHVEWSARAMDAGKHVLCEKPLAMHSQDIDALIAQRDRTGLMMAEAFMIVHHPQWQRVKALLADNAIGELLHINGLFSFRNTDVENIRNRPEMGGGGLPDIGVYTLGSTRFATGLEPEILSASLAYENGVDVKAEVHGRVGSASLFTMLSTRMHPYQEMLFHGTHGFLKLKVPFNAGVFGEPRLEHSRDGAPLAVERWPTTAQYVEQVEAFGRSVRGSAAFPWTLEDARGTQKVLEQVFAVAEKAETPAGDAGTSG
ncbi:Gfo/Idh/MocA family oxidoreductase [uncultured Shimia sp.]|uniref:Gfo/Idh/MocA family protein n=1 Tax=uncultured Shimia sp. TaxID=573152 RepID=UPI0026299D93|nr:Gfo/Idh/MocA family oxidoreductase [uncultured Shimia sp.]